VFSGQLGNHEEKLLDRLVPGSYTVLGTPPAGIFPCRTS